MTTLALAACSTTPTTPATPPSPPELLTVAEASDYTRTATGEDVDRLLRRLADRSPLVALDSIGATNEGRPISLAVVADPPVATGAEARSDDRLTVLLIGNIHAGEVCGKEALLALARELATTPDHPLLQDLIVCLIPNYNADGNDRFAHDNRPGQVGPDEMGTRHNAQDLDLNRDYVKAEAPETRALIRFLAAWDPSVVVDTHTTNGSLHGYTLTYQGPKHPSTDAPLLAYVRDTMLPEIDRAFERTSPYRAFFYGNFWEDHTLWVTYPAEPRYGVVYRGLRNRVSILSEAYAYATFRDRVLATEAFCRAVLEYSARHRDHIRALVRAADARTIEAGRDRAPIALRNEPRPFPEPVSIAGYDHDPETEGATNTPRDYECLFVNDFVPTLTVSRPRAYAIPATLTGVIALLDSHAIRYERLDAPLTAATTVYTIVGFDRSERVFQGHANISNVDVTAERAERTLPAGSVIVRADQPLGTLASFMLEPQASDGLVAWNALDDWLAPGAEFPIVRIEWAPE